MASFETSRHEPEDFDGESSSSSDANSEVRKTNTAPRISGEQLLKEVVDEISIYRKDFNDFSNDIRQRLTEINNGPTALHLLPNILANSPKMSRQSDKSIKALVEFLVKYEGGCLMRETAEYTGFTPLHEAITHSDRPLVRWICQAYDNIDEILCKPSNYHKQNCVHLAIATRNEKLASFLINLATPETLAAKDENGNTCLHLAAAHGAFDLGQLEIVRAIIDISDSHVRERDRGDLNNDCRSPFLHHLVTFEEAERKQTEALALERQHGTKVDRKQLLVQTTQFALTGGKGNEANIQSELPEKIDSAVAFSSPIDKDSPSVQEHHGKNVAPDTGLINGKQEQSLVKRPLESRRDEEARPALQKLEEKPTENFKLSEEISTFLKKHYLRSRGHDAVLDIIHGTNNDRGMCCPPSMLPDTATAKQPISNTPGH